MKYRLLFSFCLSLISVLSYAQPRYPVTAIPASLLKEAHVVKRMEDIRFEVVGLDKAIYKRKFALTILDEAGQDHADFVVGYDKLQTVSNIEGALFDAAGIQLKKVKNKEIKDYSATNDVNLYDDNRIKVHDFDYKNYPYTVEYEVEMEFRHTFYFPDWDPQPYENFAVEASSFTFITPPAYNLRYKAINYQAQPVTTTEKDKRVMKWETKNLSGLTRPYASPSWSELTPSVLFAPTEFQMEGYKGNASSWQEFGKFILTLNQGRDKLPEPVLQKVTSLTAGITDTKTKVKKLYEYLQANTRYISIQLGIGGFQPFDATYVAQKGYGDCKALSNYMYSLLKAAGIPSHHALIRAGNSLDSKSLIEDLPSTQFNHMVLFVPLEKDTIWLECTSQIEPAGYAGGFTGNRKALAITPAGGQLVNTPRYTATDNKQVRIIKGSINEAGGLQISANTKYAALQQDYISSMMSMLSKEKVKKRLNEELDFSTYDVADFAYTSKKDSKPEVDEELKITVENYATVSGKRLFIIPNIMNRSTKKVTVDDKRTVDYVFDYPFYDADSVEISIPAGYQVEAAQPAVDLKTKFGNYYSSVKLSENKIIYFRKMEQFSGRFPSTDGAALAEFYSTIYKADRSKLVLVKKEVEATNKSALP